MRLKYILYLLLLFISCSAFSQTGMISGTVKDSANNSPVKDAFVKIDGTTKGAVSFSDGSYKILNVPVGTYILIVKCFGYNDFILKNVLVHADTVTECDFILNLKYHEGDTIINLIVAAPIGSICGYVKDSADNTPLIGAFVSVYGTQFSAVTDSSGSYNIINAPIGTCIVFAKYLGYNTFIKENVKVHVGTDTKCDFSLVLKSPHEVDTIIINQSQIKSEKTGSISGYIRDSSDNSLLNGAIVLIDGTSMGDIADSNGFFKIINLPVGTYTVIAKYLGFYICIKKNILVEENKITPCDFNLIFRGAIK